MTFKSNSWSPFNSYSTIKQSASARIESRTVKLKFIARLIISNFIMHPSASASTSTIHQSLYRVCMCGVFYSISGRLLLAYFIYLKRHEIIEKKRLKGKTNLIVASCCAICMTIMSCRIIITRRRSLMML